MTAPEDREKSGEEPLVKIVEELFDELLSDSQDPEEDPKEEIDRE